LGWDLSDDSRLEFRYQRLDQTDTEYPVQFFDVNFLGSDAFSVNFIDSDVLGTGAEWRTDGWWNRSRFYGDTLSPAKDRPDFPVIPRVVAALQRRDPTINEFSGFTNGDLTSTGTRSVVTLGEEDWALFRVGGDFRYLEQQTAEQFFFEDNPAAGDVPDITTNQPRAFATDPGIFAEATLPMLEAWLIRIGGRIDWFHTEANGFGDSPDDTRRDGNLAGGIDGNADLLAADDELYAGYIANELLLTDELTNRIGFGYAERAPTLTERYADGIQLGIIQSGFSRVIGDPLLKKTGAVQIDWALEAEYTNFQGRFDLFHAWLEDYVTYSANIIDDPAGARLLRATNTDLATLAGGAVYGEYDMASWLSVFGSMYYVDGRDREIEAPLTGISPLQSRLGFRLQDTDGGNVWGLEFSARIVDNQDRLGTLRIIDAAGNVIGKDELELPTPGFTTFALRGYYNVNENVNIVSGIENLFDRNYLEHRDLRLPAQVNPNTGAVEFAPTLALAPGFSPYLGIEWTR
jgi:outer membrane receptor protein involved in Fe transport